MGSTEDLHRLEEFSPEKGWGNKHYSGTKSSSKLPGLLISVSLHGAAGRIEDENSRSVPVTSLLIWRQNVPSLWLGILTSNVKLVMTLNSELL